MGQIIAAFEAIESGVQLPTYAARTAPDEKLAPAEGAIAVINVFGVISRRVNILGDFSGGTSIEQLNKKFSEAIDNPAVSTVVLMFDSPGGSVEGLSEFADKVYQSRRKKQMIAMIDTTAASAAYYIAAACETIVCTPSGMAGSIGVLWVHEDTSQMDQAAGVKYTVIQAGQYKTEFASIAPLSEDARNYAQYQIDYYYREFVDAVAKYRGTTANNVIKNYGQGRMLTSADAMDKKMVDRVDSFETIMKELLAKAKGRQARLNSYAERKQRHAALIHKPGVTQ